MQEIAKRRPNLRKNAKLDMSCEAIQVRKFSGFEAIVTFKRSSKNIPIPETYPARAQSGHWLSHHVRSHCEHGEQLFQLIN